jgi:hypothetical protein
MKTQAATPAQFHGWFQEHGILWSARTAFIFLTQIHPSIREEDDQRRSFLLARLTLAVIPTILLVVGVIGVINPATLDDLDTWLFLLGTVSLAVAYFLNRVGFVRTATYLTVVVSTVVPLVAYGGYLSHPG